ncbi:hypothetical protein SAMN05216253_103206 [Bacteroides thetaiotaomicron]|uniref:hypothetical protein n=1 Tax=Bacteroides thetaiotaomicron TaxID=818 RepID=UPI0008A088D8|nr:hypothetical protein [Bacteroides thetaiotaomicron]MBS5446949.1 hypothetical protein [Bacteroides thetaiotaomicron]SEF82221.1 hypothetical protein SAMN05216253_103206 [Bacteroides thetaiotaomicron]
MIGEIDSSAKSNPVDVLEELCVKELVGEFIKVGSDIPPILKVPRRIHDTLKMLLWVSVCYDKKTRKKHSLMVDKFRDLFAPS